MNTTEYDRMDDRANTGVNNNNDSRVNASSPSSLPEDPKKEESLLPTMRRTRASSKMETESGTQMPKRTESSAEKKKKTKHEAHLNRDLVAVIVPEVKNTTQPLFRVLIHDRNKHFKGADMVACGHVNMNVRDVANVTKNKNRMAKLLASFKKTKCAQCAVESNLWMCATCFLVSCSREGNGHGVAHYRESGHCVAFCIDTLSFWCYADEIYLEHTFYASLSRYFSLLHHLKHGEVPQDIVAAVNNETARREKRRRERRRSEQAVEEDPPNKCAHVGKGLNRKLPSEAVSATCALCENEHENWVCLACYQTFCGRYTANGHLQNHHALNAEHDLCISLTDLSIWCNGCQEYISLEKNPSIVFVYNFFHSKKFNTQEMVPQMKRIKVNFDTFSVLDEEDLQELLLEEDDWL